MGSAQLGSAGLGSIELDQAGLGCSGVGSARTVVTGTHYEILKKRLLSRISHTGTLEC